MRNKPTKAEFPERLKTAIGDRSARAFAAEAGVSPTALHQYLTGKSEPTRPAIIAIANTAGVNLNWLVTGEGSIKGEDEWSKHFRFERLAAVTQAIIEMSCPGIDKELARRNAGLCPEAVEILEKGNEYVPSDIYVKKIVKLLATLYDFYDSDEDGARSGEITDRITSLMERLATKGKEKEKKEFEQLVKNLKDEFA